MGRWYIFLNLPDTLLSSSSLLNSNLNIVFPFKSGCVGAIPRRSNLNNKVRKGQENRWKGVRKDKKIDGRERGKDIATSLTLLPYSLFLLNTIYEAYYEWKGEKESKEVRKHTHLCVG